MIHSLVKGFILACFVAMPAMARDSGEPKQLGAANVTPSELKDIGIRERLGSTIDLQNTFVDEEGKTVQLAKYFEGYPVLLSIAYYGCPSLCGYHLNGLSELMKKMTLKMPDYRTVIVSMDHREGPELAMKKKQSYIEAIGQPGAAPYWHFLTGTEENIKKLAADVGFGFRWDEKEQQYAHAAAAYILTPHGKISRYLYGIDFDPKTVRLSMVEASDEKIGSMVDRLILFCFHYDPLKSRYAMMANNVVKIGGIVVVLVLLVLIVPFWIRQRREQRLRGENQ